mmetsp:Transcript_65745/g.183104  ORF Transcript_65745/g.183104 Transcript_65745/m.183104 type:complete len:403 (+) Transcript_65745:372-1580(+)
MQQSPCPSIGEALQHVAGENRHVTVGRVDSLPLAADPRLEARRVAVLHRDNAVVRVLCAGATLCVEAVAQRRLVPRLAPAAYLGSQRPSMGVLGPAQRRQLMPDKGTEETLERCVFLENPPKVAPVEIPPHCAVREAEHHAFVRSVVLRITIERALQVLAVREAELPTFHTRPCLEAVAVAQDLCEDTPPPPERRQRQARDLRARHRADVDEYNAAARQGLEQPPAVLAEDIDPWDQIGCAKRPEHRHPLVLHPSRGRGNAAPRRATRPATVERVRPKRLVGVADVSEGAWPLPKASCCVCHRVLHGPGMESERRRRAPPVPLDIVIQRNRMWLRRCRPKVRRWREGPMLLRRLWWLLLHESIVGALHGVSHEQPRGKPASMAGVGMVTAIQCTLEQIRAQP